MLFATVYFSLMLFIPIIRNVHLLSASLLMRWLYSVLTDLDYHRWHAVFSFFVFPFFSLLFRTVFIRVYVVFSLYFPDCILYAVGKPVYHKSTDVTYGSWLKDSHPRTKEFSEKIWTTYETDRTIIYEFADKTSFRNNQANELRLKSPGFQVCLFRLHLTFVDCQRFFSGFFFSSPL